jgi:hypothetical protein
MDSAFVLRTNVSPNIWDSYNILTKIWRFRGLDYSTGKKFLAIVQDTGWLKTPKNLREALPPVNTRRTGGM